MDINFPPTGRYVVAVSGGIDSVVLLDVLSNRGELELIVAHFNHGIRELSDADAAFVATLAKQQNLPYVVENGKLGATASEETARKARYAFLRGVQVEMKATAVITAHHQDDAIETALINLERGTGWRGLCSLRSTDTLLRPFLQVPKAELIAYAYRHRLTWREDETNVSRRYLRNRIRQDVMPQFRSNVRQEMLALLARQEEVRKEVDQLTDALLKVFPLQSYAFALPRTWLIMLPKEVGKEVLSAVLYTITNRRVPQAMLGRMWWFVKTARPHKRLLISSKLELYAKKGTVVVRTR